jgi:hypothetical protein
MTSASRPVPQSLGAKELILLELTTNNMIIDMEHHISRGTISLGMEEERKRE